jgi:hypothetical protein
MVERTVHASLDGLSVTRRCKHGGWCVVEGDLMWAIFDEMARLR